MTTGRAAWLVLVGWTVVVAFAFWRFGGTRFTDAHLVVLGLAAVATLGAWLLPLSPPITSRLAVLLGVGVVLSVQVWRLPTVESAGYLHLLIGWLALSLILAVVHGHPLSAGRLALALAVLGVVEAGIGIVQALGGIDYIGSYFRDVGAIATGTLINRNHFAGLLNMVWPLALAAVAVAPTHRRRHGRLRLWGVLASCALMGIAVLLSQSRGGTLVMIATAIYMTTVLFVGRRQMAGGAGAVLVPVALVLAVAVVGLVVGLEPLADRFGGLEKEVSRLDVYLDTIELIGDQPIAGVGPGLYRWHFRPYQSVWAGVWYQHAHNDYLESAAEWGVPLALIVWGGVLFRCLRAARTYLESHDPRIRALSLGASAAIFSMAAHSLVDLNLQVPGNLLVFASIIGMAWALDLHRSQPEAVS